MRFQHKLGPLKVLNQHLVQYPTPINLSYAYNFGSLAGIVLFSQIITGILLAMHYTAHVDLAFNSVVHLMNDVPSGMILRYGHANGASLFFVVVYIHILRGVYYSSGNQPREMVWITGVVILLAMVVTAFIGYFHSQKWISNDAIIFLVDFNPEKLFIWTKNLIIDACAPLARELREINEVYFPALANPFNSFNSFKLIIMDINHIDYLSIWSVSEKNTRSVFFLACDACYAALPGPIILNTKNHNKINITPVKSYYNLHLISTQLNIQKENKQKAGVYIVMNNINGNFYVGSASSNRINTRFRNHCIHLKSSNKPLLRAINKYGIQNFSFHIVEYFNGFVNKENLKLNHLKLLERESFFISYLKPIYNILTYAGSSLGFKHTDETPHKMQINYSQERKNQIGNLNKGKTLTKDVRDQLKLKAKERFSDVNFKTEFLLKNKDNLFKGKNVILCNAEGDILSRYTSIQQVSQVFSINRKTVRKYLKSGKLFRELGVLKIDN